MMMLSYLLLFYGDCGVLPPGRGGGAGGAAATVRNARVSTSALETASAIATVNDDGGHAR